MELANNGSILKFLNKENPPVQHQFQQPYDHRRRSQLNTTSRSGMNNTCSYMAPFQVKKWTEFNFDTFKQVFRGQLFNAATEPTVVLPPHPHLSPKTDRIVRCENSTRHILTKWTHGVVQTALDALPSRFNACEWAPVPGVGTGVDQALPASVFATPTTSPAPDDFDMISPPSTSRKRRLASSSSMLSPRSNSKAAKVIPDAGTTLTCHQHGSECPSSLVERLPKEYKPFSKFRSSVLDNFLDDNGRWREGTRKHNDILPIRQAYTYCVRHECRYGCILTTEEAFIFRIRPRDDDNNGTLKTCVTTNGLLEYASIPWKGEGKNGLGFNLALWFVHVLAGNHYEVDWEYKPLSDEQLRPATCIPPSIPTTIIPSSSPVPSISTVDCSPSSSQQTVTNSPRSRLKRTRHNDDESLGYSFATSVGSSFNQFRHPHPDPSSSNSQDPNPLNNSQSACNRLEDQTSNGRNVESGNRKRLRSASRAGTQTETTTPPPKTNASRL